ncbi:uncharacterized protein ACO6RY_00098 [Pungitius sinensis]
MLRIQVLLPLLVLCAGSLDAWWWPSHTIVAPALTTPASATPASATPANATPASATPASGPLTEGEEEEEEDDDLSGVGEEIVSVATGIRKSVEAWDATPAASTTNGAVTEEAERAGSNTTGNTRRFGEERVGQGGGSGVEGSDVEVLALNLTRTTVDPLTPPDGPANRPDQSCLPVPPAWPICSVRRPESFALPNFLNHTTAEEVGAVLQEWAWLPGARCHHSAEWFLCLLLAPACPQPAEPPPCRSFCQVLQDSCWASLEGGRLPVECHLLPERACASVSNLKGNAGG